MAIVISVVDTWALAKEFLMIIMTNFSYVTRARRPQVATSGQPDSRYL